MHNGWICLHRSLLDWEWYQNQNVKTVFIHCLLKANWEDKRWEGTEIQRGEFVTSIQNIAEETGLSVMCVRRALEKLEKTGEISRRATNRYTVIKCLNYALYQDEGNKERQTDNYQKPYSRRTADIPATTTNNNNKKNNDNKKPDRIKSKPSFDIEEIKRRAVYDDDYDI